MRQSRALIPLAAGEGGKEWGAQSQPRGEPPPAPSFQRTGTRTIKAVSESTHGRPERGEGSPHLLCDAPAHKQPPRCFARRRMTGSRHVARLLLSATAAFALILSALVLAAACSRSVIPPEPPPPKGIVDLDETGWEEVRARQRGRVLLVDFWATWCDPCREEFPNLVRLHNAYRSRGLSLVAISMDEPESVPAIQRFLQSQGATFGSYRQHFRDFEVLVNSINPRWGGGIPATFLYDREGKLASSWEGATTYPEFESAVKRLLP